MPCFDVTSTVNEHELSNGVDQTNREVGNRYDFKGSNARVEHNETQLVVNAESEFQINQMIDILYKKLAKRGIDVSCLDSGTIEISGKRAKLALTVRQGIDKDLARKIVKIVKDSKLKAQTAVQGEQVRISGKKRDDLQAIITLLRESNLGLPLQFVNFRD